MQHKKSSEIIRENLTYMLNQEGTPSMRNLSTSIGTSDSYIQKILNQERTPSLDKIDSISEFFDVESWEMFYNFRKDRPEMLAIMQQLNKLSPTLLPSVKAYLDFLLAQQDELLSTKKQAVVKGFLTIPKHLLVFPVAHRDYAFTTAFGTSLSVFWINLSRRLPIFAYFSIRWVISSGISSFFL